MRYDALTERLEIAVQGLICNDGITTAEVLGHRIAEVHLLLVGKHIQVMRGGLNGRRFRAILLSEKRERQSNDEAGERPAQSTHGPLE